MSNISQSQKRSWSRLLAYVFRVKSRFLPGLLVELLAVAADLGAPMLVGLLLNRELDSRLGARDYNFFIQLLAAYLLLTFIGSGLRYLSGCLLQSAANRIAYHIQRDVFHHLQNLPIAYFDRLPAGKVVSRVMNDSKAVKQLFNSVLAKLLTATVYAVGIYISLSFLDYRLSLMALLPLLPMVLVIMDFQKKSAKYTYLARRQLSDLNGQLNENIQGIEVLQAFNREARRTASYEDANEKYYQANFAMTKLWSYSAHNITWALQTLTVLAVLAYFGLSSIETRALLPIGSLYIFMDYMSRLFGQLNEVAQRIGSLEQAKGAAEHIFELLDEEALSLREGEIPRLQGQIDFREVSFAYLEEDVLHHASFSIQPGETAAFVGHTGSGKSTIMNLLLGFYELREGEIRIDGRSLTDYPLRSLRRQMAIVLQDPFLFSGTVYSNISLGNPEISREQAIQALCEVGAAALLERLPKGIDSKVSEGGKSFSLGERQLIAFARALAANPRILILDEATANIDSETEALIQHGIQRLQQDRSTLIIAHRLATVRHAAQIFVLDQGIIVEHGSHDELMAQNGVYARMVAEQAQGAL